MKQPQADQDSEYSFPYHYIPQFRGGYSQVRAWTWGTQYLSAIELVLDAMASRNKGVKSIADVGCGDGRFSRELAIRFPKTRVVGVDYSERAVSLARAMNPGMSFSRKDILRERLRRRFDAVTLIETLEHIPKRDCSSFMQALARLLRRDGRLYLTVPHQNKPLSYKHFQHFDAETLRRYSAPYFEVDFIQPIQRPSRLMSLLDLCMTNTVFTVTHPGLNRFVYWFYKRRYLITTENRCGRLFAVLRKAK